MNPRPPNSGAASQPIPLNAALNAVADDLKAGSTSEIRAITTNWAEIVGQQLSEHTVAGSMIDGVLTIHASDSAAASVVRQRSGDIGRRYGEATAQTVRQLRVIVARKR